MAKGVPNPTIIWQKGNKVIGNNEIGNQLVYSGKRFHITTEGSLVIFDPRADDEDLYVCIAKNSVGSTLYRTNLYIDLSKCFFMCFRLTYVMVKARCLWNVAIKMNSSKYAQTCK